MENDGQKIIEIVPLTRIPLSRNQSFSYIFGQEIPLGSLVSIPLFKRVVEGIVIGNKNDFERYGNIKLKKVEKIISEKVVDEKQLKLANFISEYYLVSLGIVLKFFVFKKIKEKFRISKKNIKIRKIRLNQAQKEAVKIISSNLSKFLLFGPAGSGKTEIYINSILKIKKKRPNGQFLVLLPELTLTPQTIERFSAYFGPENISVVNSKISKGKLYTAWEKINSGKHQIVIGSRMSAFLPFKNLALIAIDEEQDISFKQWDMNPRYDARKVVDKLSEMHQCPIVFGSATPQIESYYKTRKGELNIIRIPRIKNLEKNDIEIVDLKKEKWLKNQSPISKKLEGEIRYALGKNLQTLLFINRQGMSSFSVCQECRSVLKCPDCERALIYGKEGYYYCIHCSYKTSITPVCQKCKGIIFKNLGLGTQRIEKEIRNIFPGAKIKTMDNISAKESGSREKLYESLKKKEINILIGTQMISKGWDLPSLGLVGIIDADNLFSIPDFRSKERAFQHILQASGRINRPKSDFPGKVIIQTFNPDWKIFSQIKENQLENFYLEEIEERKILRFPPFSKIIKIVFRDRSLKKTEAETIKIFSLLKKISPEKISVSEPSYPLVFRTKNIFKKQIIIKIHSRRPEGLEEIIKSLSSSWIVDVDPISIV